MTTFIIDYITSLNIISLSLTNFIIFRDVRLKCLEFSNIDKIKRTDFGALSMIYLRRGKSPTRRS